MQAHHFLIDLALVLCVAGLTTALFQRLRQPIVLGYLLAGAIVSPHTPFPLFAEEQTIHAFSELGVILLMFSLGLEFSFAKLLRVAPTAGLVAVIQCSLMLWLGYVTGQLLGWTPLESLYTGAMLAISSTTIIFKAFAEQRITGRLTEIVFGILIVEDLIAIVLLAMLTTVSTGDALTVADFGATAARLAAFLALIVVGGLLTIPRLTRLLVRLDRPETTVVASIGVCFAFALFADAAGYSVALGAFVAGALVAESGEAEPIEQLVRPIRDIFAAIFFVSVGMLLNPAVVAEHWPAVLVLTAVVVLGKVCSVAAGVFLTGEGVRTSVQAGMSLAQIGEFSFIIAALGLSSGATGAFLYPVAVTVSALTTLLTPWLIRASDPVATILDRWLPRPVQTAAALYGTWVGQLRAGPREKSVGRRLRHLGRLLLLDSALLAAIVIATSVWSGRVAAIVSARTELSEEITFVAVLVASSILAVPLLVGIARCTSAFAKTLAAIAFPPAGASRIDLADAPRRVLVRTLEIGALLLVGIPLAAVTQPFLPSLPGPALVAVLFVLLALALWRSARNLQEHAQAGVQVLGEVLAGQMARQAPGSEARDVDLEPIDDLLPGLGAPKAVRIRQGTNAIGKSLAELNLRGRTGATVLAILRPDEDARIPTSKEKLRLGDLLAVAGTADAIASAERLLTDPALVTGIALENAGGQGGKTEAGRS